VADFEAVSVDELLADGDKLDVTVVLSDAVREVDSDIVDVPVVLVEKDTLGEGVSDELSVAEAVGDADVDLLGETLHDKESDAESLVVTDNDVVLDVDKDVLPVDVGESVNDSECVELKLPLVELVEDMLVVMLSEVDTVSLRGRDVDSKVDDESLREGLSEAVGDDDIVGDAEADAVVETDRETDAVGDSEIVLDTVALGELENESVLDEEEVSVLENEFDCVAVNVDDNDVLKESVFE
jgi:hypothetical protein